MCNGLMQMPARARPPRPAPRAAPSALSRSEAGTPDRLCEAGHIADDSDLCGLCIDRTWERDPRDREIPAIEFAIFLLT